MPASIRGPAPALAQVATTVQVPHFRTEAQYAALRGQPLTANLLDQQAIPRLHQAGEPAARIADMAKAMQQIRVLLATTQQGASGGDPADAVEIDLRVAFYTALAKAVALGPGPVADRRAALQYLRALAASDGAAGVPAADERRRWTLTARATALAEIDVQIEGLR